MEAATVIRLTTYLANLVPAAALALVCGCGSQTPKGDQPAKPATQAGGEPQAVADKNIADTPTATSDGTLLSWIDPDAVGVLYRSGGDNPVDTFDAAAVVTLFGLPPRAEQVLHDHEGVLNGLAMLLGVERDGLSEWLSGEAVAMLPVMSRGTYVVLRTTKPTADLAQKLAEAGMLERELEGMKVLEPTGSFVWRAVLLEEQTIAFVPATEVGSGLGPLTAARDLPPSEIETQLVQLKQQDHLMLSELFLQGPMMHIDLDDPIGIVRFTLRRWQQTGVEGIVMMQPLGDPAAAAKTLEDRDGSLETEQMKLLMDRVAFVAEGPVVQGRLQMPAEDLRHLQGHH